MENCKSVTMPADPNQKLDKNMEPRREEEVKEMKKMPYREAIGNLLYVCQGSRSHISFATEVVSRFYNNPGKAHWSPVKIEFSGTKRDQLTENSNSLHGSSYTIGILIPQIFFNHFP